MVVTTSPAVQADGQTCIFSVSGFYVYGYVKTPVFTNDALPLGSLSYETVEVYPDTVGAARPLPIQRT